MIIKSQTEKGERVVVVDGNILSENYFQVFPAKCFDIGIVGYIIVVIPIRKLVMERMGEAQES